MSMSKIYKIQGKYKMIFYNRTQIINMNMVATMNLKRSIKKNNMVMA